MNIDVRVKTFFLILVKTKSWSIDTNKEKLYVREVSSFSFTQPFLLGEDLTAAVRQMSRLFPLSSRADSKERLLSSLVLVCQGHAIVDLRKPSGSLLRGFHWEWDFILFHFLLRKEKLSIWAKRTYLSTGIASDWIFHITFSKLMNFFFFSRDFHVPTNIKFSFGTLVPIILLNRWIHALKPSERWAPSRWN